MADFELKLQQLSERGNPVGAEELIERIEAELAGNPLVVVAKQRKGTSMTQTDETTRTEYPRRRLAIGWAVAAIIAILAAVGVYWALAPNADRVVDTVPPSSSTTAPEIGAMTPLETIEAGVAALYSGDGDRAAELFELSDSGDELIRGQAAYQAAIEGRVTIRCVELGTANEFSCHTRYYNALTDAIGYFDSGDESRAVVNGAEITEFSIPEHSWILQGIGVYLVAEGRFEGYEDCMFAGVYPPSCAAIQIENVEGWNDWQGSVEGSEIVEMAVESWYGGDCAVALFMKFLSPSGCAVPWDSQARSIEYEAILGAEATLQNCTEADTPLEPQVVTCELHYSNAMNAAVSEPESVTVEEFAVFDTSVQWSRSDHSGDAELRESFRIFAQSGELADDYEYAAAGCAAIDRRTPECATLIVDNLEAWAAWYEVNG